MISEVLYSKSSDFQDLSVFITLYAIDIYNVRCLEQFLPLRTTLKLEFFGTELAELAETLSYKYNFNSLAAMSNFSGC